MPGTAKLLERCRVAFELSDHTLDSASEKAQVARSTFNNYIKGIQERNYFIVILNAFCVSIA